MRLYFFIRLVLHLFEGLATCALIFPFLGHDARQGCIRRWSARLLRLCGVHVTVRSLAPETAPALIIANHVSWLDIFVINAMAPCRFVAKAEIRRWPLVGWLCSSVQTIFIARGRQREVRHTYQGLVQSIHNGERVAFFPEGTTSPQGSVLPFHANLFEAAIEARVPVQPYAIRYADSDGAFHPHADFVGETTFGQSVWSVLGRRDFHTELLILPAIDSKDMHRRELATQCREAIARALERAVSAEATSAAEETSAAEATEHAEGSHHAEASDHAEAAKNTRSDAARETNVAQSPPGI